MPHDLRIPKDTPEATVGTKWGTLMVIATAKQDRFGHKRVIVKCSCGVEKIAHTASLRNGTTVTCGGGVHRSAASLRFCYRPENAEMVARNDLYRRRLYEARRRKISFGLVPAEFFKLSKMPCHFCGAEPNAVWIRRGNKRLDGLISILGECKYNGLDRLDCSKGYIRGNVVPCCYYCNIAKGELDEATFLGQVARIFKHRSLTLDHALTEPIAIPNRVFNRTRMSRVTRVNGRPAYVPLQ